MKTIFKGNKFSIVWEIFHNTTRLPFDFTGMNIEVSLTSNSYSGVLSNFNVKENVISTEIEANSLPSGVYDILCRFSTLNEQAYCFYKNAFHISNNPCFCDKSEKIEISTYATYVTPNALLTQFNSIYLRYLGNPKNTRNNIPEGMRRKGLIITYTDESNKTITERATSAAQKDNDHWGLDTNWSRIDELSLSGDLSVSANGTWIINGEDTQIKAVGPKGDTGITPWLKTIDNRLYYSYDGENWEACSEEIAAFFRFKSTREESNGATIGNIQISRDNKNWQDLSPEFVNHLRISAYVSTKGELPTNKPVGTMYGVGPTYKEEDTARANPIYRIYVYDGTTWVDNGSFTSIAAGIVQETGEGENVVMSQKAVSVKLNEAMSEVESLKIDVRGELMMSFSQSDSGWNYYPISIVLKKDGTYSFSIKLDSAIDSSFYWHVIDEVEGDVFATKVINVGGVSGSYELVMQKNFQSPMLAVHSGVSIPAMEFFIRTKSINKDIEDISKNLEGVNKAVDELEGNLNKLQGGTYRTYYNVSDLGVLVSNRYINEHTGKIEESSNCIITNSIYLQAGDTVKAFTGGTGIAVIAKSENKATPTTIFTQIAIANNLKEPIHYEITEEGYYTFSGKDSTQGNNALSVEIVKMEYSDGVVGDIEHCKKKIDGLYEGEVSMKEYNIDDLKGEGANINYYLHATTLNRESSNDCIITKPIYLNVGDEIKCSTGGDGVCLFARTPSGVINGYYTDCISMSGSAKSYEGVIKEDGWYVFSGRINRNDGTNLVVNVRTYDRGKNIFEQLDEKVDRSELGNLVVDSGNSVESIGYALSVGADSVKDKVPNSPWFDAVDNDGTTYGTYLDDKIDSVPQGNSFIFISDAHYKWNNKQSAKLIDYVRRRLGIKTIIHGGDVINEAPTVSQAAKEWLDFNRDFVFRIGGDFKQVCGDHDHNGKYADEGQALSYQFIQKAMNGYNIKELHYDEIYDSQIEEISAANGWSENDKKEYDAWKKMHYYFDDNTIQTRFIVLHTGWTGDVGLAVDKLGSNALSESNALYLQIEFLYESLLSCPTGYNVVVVGHNVIGNKQYSIATASGNIVRYNVNEPVWKGSWVNVDRMIRAFKNKSSVSLSYKDWSGSGLQTKTFDFGEANSIGIVFCMGGDVHWDILAKTNESEELKPIDTATIDNVIVTEGVISKGEVLHALTMTDGSDRGYKVIVATPNGNYNDSTDSVLASNPNTEGTLDSQAFDIVTIANDAIYFTRIGSGKDRIIHITEP